MLKMRMLGAQQSAANIRKMDKAVRRAFYEEMLKIAKDVHARSLQYVPYLTGALARSSEVKGYPGRYPVVYVSYGSDSVPYALMQHENMNFDHPGGGRAKYLEIAAKEFEPKAKERIATATRTETKKHSMAGKGMAGFR